MHPSKRQKRQLPSSLTLRKIFTGYVFVFDPPPTLKISLEITTNNTLAHANNNLIRLINFEVIFSSICFDGKISEQKWKSNLNGIERFTFQNWFNVIVFIWDGVHLHTERGVKCALVVFVITTLNCEVVVKWAQAHYVRQKSSLQVLFDTFVFQSHFPLHSSDTPCFHSKDFVIREIVRFLRNIFSFIIIIDLWWCDDLEHFVFWHACVFVLFVMDIKMYWILIFR